MKFAGRTVVVKNPLAKYGKQKITRTANLNGHKVGGDSRSHGVTIRKGRR